jgi:hypothetical protein
VVAGSLPAFATYLHSLADSYSHDDCIAQMDALGKPWATHTTVSNASTNACLYHPKNMQADDVHGREFYTYTDSLRTDAAIRTVYGELISRSMQSEGQYPPIALSTPISGAQTLSETLAVYVHAWDYDHAAERRAYLDQLTIKVLMQRNHIYLPLTIK